MADLIQCDGGCGKISPDPETRLHTVNGWLTVAAKREHGGYISRKGVYCGDCAPRVLGAMNGSDEPPPAPIIKRPIVSAIGLFWLFALGVAVLLTAKAVGA